MSGVDRAQQAPATNGNVDSDRHFLGNRNACQEGRLGRFCSGDGESQGCAQLCGVLRVHVRESCASTSCARVHSMCAALFALEVVAGLPRWGSLLPWGAPRGPGPAHPVCLQWCGARPVWGGPRAALASANCGLSTACAQVMAQRSRPRGCWLRGPQLSLLVHVVARASVCWWMW